MSRFSHALALTGYFGLLVLLVLWWAWLEPPEQWPIAEALIVLVGPLLPPLRGLLHGRAHAHIWTSLLALFYFAVGIFHVAGPMTRPWLAWLAIGFSLLLLTGVLLYVRSRVREAGFERVALESIPDRPGPVDGSP
jgi:uncharacterized membrane protein